MTWRSTQTGIFVSGTLSIIFLTACATLKGPYAEIKFAKAPDRDVASLPASLGTNHMAPANAQLGGTDWKLIFNRLFAVNIHKTVADDNFDNVAAHSIYYSKNDFNQLYSDITKVNTSEQAYRRRESELGFYGDNRNDLGRAWENMGGTPAVQDFREALKASHEEKFDDDHNYFETTMGKKIDSIFHDTVFVVIPGFGSHTIKDYTWPEIVSAANKKYGRAISRPDAVAAPYENFYDTGAKEVGFDIVHPMGDELGFSMGRDKDSADKLAQWLVNLKKIPAYRNKKWLLLGYSKGAGISQNMVANHPEIRKDVLAIVTMAGVNQGAIPAENGLNTVRSVFHVDELNPFFASIKTDVEKTRRVAETLTSNMLGINTDLGATVGKYADSLSALIGTQAPQLAADAYYKVLFGIEDMSVFQRAEWNLENMNDAHFTRPISIFNISAIANIADFMLPNGFEDGKKIASPLIIPQFNPLLQIINKGFSRDDLFLYVTSLTGFRQSPGGLFDTQVAWLDTKSMALDQRPLKDSLNAADLVRLQKHVESKGLRLPANFAETPRADLLYSVNQGHMSNINFIDLGEVRGTHWDLAFQQVYKPKDDPDYYTHRFPRRALQASVLETLALYRLMGGMK